MADVTQFMGDDTLELDPVHLLEQSGGDRDRRVLGVAAGRERVRCRVVDDVDARLGEPPGDAQALDEVVQALVLLGIGRSGAAHRERDSVGLPVRDERHGPGDDEGDDREHDPVPDQHADGRADEGEHHDEGGDERDAPALVRRDLVVHGGVWCA